MAEPNKILRTMTLNGLRVFADGNAQLAIAEREAPNAAGDFFQKLIESDFQFAGKVTVRKSHAVADIQNILEDEISDELKADPFYPYWVMDMAKICQLFCDLEQSSKVGFWLGSKRGCSRYHIDNVPQRLLITYAGIGTEWLPDEAVDRQAFSESKPLEHVIKDPSAIKYMQRWDVAIFKGGETGLLHRSPEAAMNEGSILMRLDHAKFWETIRNYEMQNAALAS